MLRKQQQISRSQISSSLRRSCVPGRLAEIVARKIGFTADQIIYDDRLIEYQFGVYDGSLSEYQAVFPSTPRLFTHGPEGGETENDVRVRIGDFLYGLDQKYSDKKILIISHGDPLWILLTVARGATIHEAMVILENDYVKKAECRELDFIPLPHNEEYELDLHRPYIDDIVLVSEKGTELRRVKEVMDVWFDSGAMPFAQAAKERKSESLDVFLKKVEYPVPIIFAKRLTRRADGSTRSSLLGRSRGGELRSRTQYRLDICLMPKGRR